MGIWARREAWAPWAAGLVLASAMTLLSLQAPFNHDEEQYVAAAVLARSLRPILDFAYLQTPLQPWVEAPLVALAPGHVFVAARLASVAFALAALAGAFAIVRRAGASAAFAALAVVWIGGSGVVRTLALTARNDALPAALTVLGLLALREGVRARGPTRRLPLAAIAGLALSLALCAKLTYVFAPAAGGLWLLWEAGRRRAGPAEVAAFAAGAAAGVAPILWAALADPQATLFDLYGFHHDVTPLWYVRNGLTERRGPLFHALFWAVIASRDPAVVGALLLAAGLAIARLIRRAAAPAVDPGARGADGLVALAAALAFVAAWLPNPSFTAYAAPPCLLLMLAVAVRAGSLPGACDRRAAAGVMALSALAGWAPALPDAARGLARPQDWTVARTHAAAEAVRGGWTRAGARGPVATLSPIRALDAGLPTYPEFAAGPFLFRAGDDVSPATAARIRAATPRTLDVLFAARAPGAIVTGYEAGSFRIVADAPLAGWARAHGFSEAPLPDGGRLFLPPPKAPAR